MRMFPAVLLAVVLAACGTDDVDRARTEAEKQRALEESTFGEMTGTLDKAREVEELNADRKRQLDEAVEESEGR